MLHTGTRTPNSGIKLNKQKNCSRLKIKNFWETKMLVLEPEIMFSVYQLLRGV